MNVVNRDGIAEDAVLILLRARELARAEYGQEASRLVRDTLDGAIEYICDGEIRGRRGLSSQMRRYDEAMKRTHNT